MILTMAMLVITCHNQRVPRNPMVSTSRGPLENPAPAAQARPEMVQDAARDYHFSGRVDAPLETTEKEKHWVSLAV